MQTYCKKCCNSLQADINQEADQFEEILRKNRAKMEAASRELADWELQTARARNEGTFFKGLFKADILQQPPSESQAPYEREPSALVHSALLHVWPQVGLGIAMQL